MKSAADKRSIGMIRTTILAVLSAWLAAAAGAHGQDTRALIEQALNEPAKITLENVKLNDAIQIVGEQTGLKIVMPPEAMELVPNGGETVVEKVDIVGVPLRQGLARLFTPLGMNFVVADDHIRIVPKDGLQCLGRAATWEELDLLAQLSAMQLATDSQVIDKVQTLIQFQGGPHLSWRILFPAIRNVGAGAGDDVLSIACTNLGWTWCVSGQRIIVTPVEFRIQRLLQQPIQVRVNNRPLDEVLATVGDQAGIRVRAEPGALASLPIPMQQNFSLNASQLPAERVLDKIASSTGLGYLIAADGVVFYHPATHEGRAPEVNPPAAATASADPYVAKCIVEIEPGKTFEWLIRASELPSDLREMRQRDLQDFFEAARKRSGNETP